MRKFWLAVVLSLLVCAQSVATTLSDRAAQMPAGSWFDFTSSVNGFFPGGTTILATGGGHINEFSDKGVWNPIAREAMFYGIRHDGLNWKFVKYTDSNNNWSVIEDQPGGIGHAYGYNAMDQGTGTFYFLRRFAGAPKQFSRFVGGLWSNLSDVPMSSFQVAQALEFFPERNQLMLVDGDWGIWMYSVSSNTWALVAETNGSQGHPELPKLSMGPYHMVAVYNPVGNFILFGGGNGSGNLYRMASNGTITTETTAPATVAVNSSVFTVDPSSGEYLLFTNDGRFYKYNPGPKIWTQMPPSQNPPFFTTGADGPANGTVAFPVTTYGVVMFTTWAHANSKVYLYKHGVAPPDTTPPSIPTNLSATPLSSSQISLTWTASTDNSGVIGYRVERCTGSSCVNFVEVAAPSSPSHSSTGLTASTTYRFRVRAVDFANNFSGYSSIVSATTHPPGGVTFTQKCAQPGVVSCFGLDSSSSLFYNWPIGTVCDTTFAGQTNYSINSDRAGPGNTAAIVQNGQCIFPAIDTAVKHSGTGSIRWTVPSQSSANSSGFYTEPFKRDPFIYFAPGSPSGNVFYLQFYQRFDANMMLNVLGGWKQMIIYGVPPQGASASNMESTLTSSDNKRGIPIMYGQIGADDYGVQDVRGCTFNFNGLNTYPEPPCIRYRVDQWMEFTIRIEVLGSTNTPSSHVQLWVNGELTVDYPAARVDWQGFGGFGQFQATPYHTGKDPSIVHPVAQTWMDDIIISTQPIAMTSGVPPGPDTTPPAPPSGVIVR